MTAYSKGLLVLLVLIASAVLSPIPESPIVCAFLVGGTVWVESKSLVVGSQYRFSPSAPLLLGACCTTMVGPLPVALATLFAALSGKGHPLSLLGERLSLCVSLLLALLANVLYPEQFLARCLGVVLVYLALRILMEINLERPKRAQERSVWRRIALQLRPFEASLALAGLPFAYLIQSEPWSSLLLLPLLAGTHLVAESIVLNSSDKAVAQAFQSLRESRKRERQQAAKLDQVTEDKTILENFAEHLSSQPSLLEVCQALVATSDQLLSPSNIVVFLNDPPEPFCYRVQPEILAQVQAQSLLQLPEPAVSQAQLTQKTVIKEHQDSADKRLLSLDRVVTALPLGAKGVLCVGSSSSPPKRQLERLQWLTEKAALAMEAAHRQHREQVKKRASERRAANLEKRVEHLATLVKGAENFASSLDPEELRVRFLNLVKETFRHDGGLYQEPDGTSTHWGPRLVLPESLTQELADKNQAILINDPSRLQKLSETKISGVLVVPLTIRESHSFLALLSRGQPFSAEEKDKLFILSSQAAMAQSNARLYQEVLQARVELEQSQDRLIQSSKMTAMGQLSAGMAHELNSPIGAVSICLDEAKELLESDPALAERLMEKGQVAVERARIIIERLLDYCRLEELKIVPLDFVSLLEDTLDFLSFQLKNVEVELETQEASVSFKGDYFALQQVLSNLFTNAALATAPRETPHIRIKLQSTKRELVVQVTDNGTGIDPEHLPRIFDPFFTTRQPGDGVGLGLWASHQIVERHGGSLKADSEAGEGSTFTLTLPHPIDQS